MIILCCSCLPICFRRTCTSSRCSKIRKTRKIYEMKAIMGESVLILHDGFTILPSDTLKVKIRFFCWNALAFESRVCKCKSRVDYDKNFFWNFCSNFFLDLLAYEIKEPAGISKRKFCHFLLYYSYIVCTIYPAMTSVNCTFLHILDHFVILTCALSFVFF